jgi:hypothetical protein
MRSAIVEVNMMTAVAERPTSIVLPPGLYPPTGAQSRALALAFLQQTSACWRGETLTSAFETRLGAYWCPDMPPVPETVSDAMSPHGGGGRGIFWRDIGGEILGHIPGSRGGYRIPVGAVSRLVACAARSWLNSSNVEAAKEAECRASSSKHGLV